MRWGAHLRLGVAALDVGHHLLALCRGVGREPLREVGELRVVLHAVGHLGVELAHHRVEPLLRAARSKGV